MLRAREPVVLGEAVGDGCCSICREDVGPEPYIVPECRHAFHAACLLPWFRMGNSSCPYCRAQPPSQSRPSVAARYKLNRRLALRKNAPAGLKRLVARIRKQEAKDKADRQAWRAWKQSKDGKLWADLNKTRGRLARAAWKATPCRRFYHTGGPPSTSALRHEIAEYPVVPGRV
jgi:hypothetical protein